jgi:hypothetical protein
LRVTGICVGFQRRSASIRNMKGAQAEAASMLTTVRGGDEIRFHRESGPTSRSVAATK